MDFASQLLSWFQTHGRRDLPWQKNITPYRVWISEIMLQQTQVATVIPYYQKFMARFPDIHSLAAASEENVLQLWAGLGYYARGRNLHKTAMMIVTHFNAIFPKDTDSLMTLPGIGRSTAHAILSISHGQRLAILDGNVKRVLTRFLGITEYPGTPLIEKKLWHDAQSLLPKDNMPAYTQAIMDLGAMICTRTKPRCTSCPMQRQCYAYQHKLTDSIPMRKAKKNYPTKTQYCLLMVDAEQKHIFLERRQNKGIWGGLNTPLFFDDENALKLFLDKSNLTIKSSAKLALRVHKFTHFQLHFTPWLMVTTSPTFDTLQRYRLDDVDHLALPAPIKTLLQELRDGLITSYC